MPGRVLHVPGRRASSPSGWTRARAAGAPAPGTWDADGGTPGPGAAHAAIADRALTAFLRERFKGTRPIAQGRQLQELLMTNGIYVGVLGLDSLAGATEPAPVAEEEAVDAAR